MPKILYFLFLNNSDFSIQIFSLILYKKYFYILIVNSLPMKIYRFFTVIILASVLLTGCKKKYTIDLDLFKQSFANSFNTLDSVQKKFYSQIYDTENPRPYWYNNVHDFNQKLDILNRFLSKSTEEHGINSAIFLVDSISKISASIDSTNVDYAKLARLEMMMSKSYFDYCSAMKYGCFNPRKLYSNEYFIDVKRPDETFTNTTFDRLIEIESLQNYLDSIQPKTKDYIVLQRELKVQSTLKDRSKFWKIAANLERLRWTPVKTISHKHVRVNAANAMLQMMRGDSIVNSLRVCVGKSGEHETPLMIGDMYEVILNPTWTVPTSIVVNEIVKKGGGIPSYIARNNMKIYKNGKVQHPCSIPWNLLNEKNQPYRIVQDSGNGNSLGLIKFNFDNPFSVYLHDTNARHVFNNLRRDVSHGCVRVQNPLKLAFFCLNDIDTTKKAEVNKRKLFEDRMRFSIGMKPVSEENAKTIAKTPEKKLRYIPLKPKVTVIIDYKTCYVGEDGKLVFTEDYYKMDDILMKKLNNIKVKTQIKPKESKDDKKKDAENKKDTIHILKVDTAKVEVEKKDSI